MTTTQRDDTRAVLTNTPRAVFYGRQSRTMDGSESLGIQDDAARATAARFGLEIIREIIEPPSTSAYKDRGRSRPRFPELLDLVRSGAVQVVIAYKSDRLSRGGGPGWAPLLEAAEEAGLDLDRFVLTPGGFMSEAEIGFRATMDREEAKKMADRSTDNAARRAQNGRPAGGGYRPYGLHRRDKGRRNLDGTYEPCPRCGSAAVEGLCEPEVEVVRHIVTRYVCGDGTRIIARSLNEASAVACLLGRRGWLTSTGSLWREGTVLLLLRSPHIAGKRVHNPGGTNGKKRKRSDSSHIIGPAAWPAMIGQATWDRLEVRLANNGGPAGPSPWKYLLPRLLRCSRCGGRLSGAPSHGRPRYRCQKGSGKMNCGGLQIVTGPVDELVVGMLLYRLESPVVADALAGRSRPTTDEVDDTVERIVTLERRLEEAAKAFAEGDITIKDFSTMRRRIDEQLAELQRRRARQDHLVTISEFLDNGEALRDRWEALTLPRKQRILAAVIDRVVVHPSPRRGSKSTRAEEIAERLEVVWRV